jgi:hypothetical protein
LARRFRLARCGRLSSAVAALGFEYGLRKAKRRIVVWQIMVWQSKGSPTLPNGLLRLYSSPFFLPTAAFVVPRYSEFPDFPFVKPA